MTLRLSDRRQASRLEVNLHAHYDSTSMDMSAVTSISRTGLFLRSIYLDDPGSMVALSLDLPEQSKPVAIAGKVVRVGLRPESSGMGIRFTDLSSRCRLRLDRFVEDADSEQVS